ncbi:MAG: endonuclease III [Candidatus Thorarchaeota archaeon]|nr:endonuclease III [Candidatus Thorarchaeota archaeon]
MNKNNTATKIVKILDKTYPDAPKTYLNFQNPFEMLIATILSARATDAGVNKISPILFKKYPTPEKMSKANLEEIGQIIRPLGAFNKKAGYITETSRQLVDRFGSSVPKTMEELISFPGASRKTANVVLSVVFGLSEGVVVDTHVMRVTVRLGLSEHDKKPQKIEKGLMELLPNELWNDYARLIGAHGRRTCKSRKPNCIECILNKLCPSAVFDE